jgi:hypothetical protein
MICNRFYSIVGTVLTFIGVTAFMLVPSCGSNKEGSQESGSATSSQVNKHVVPGAPENALFGQIFRSPYDKRTWIYDGRQWVPHDRTVDEYYTQLNTPNGHAVVRSMTQDEVKSAPCTTADGTGAHPKHAGFDCKTCHMVGGVMCFNPAGPAVAAGQPAPLFDATAKSCSNVACHSVQAGTFSYYFPGDEMDADGYPIPELKTVSYGGASASITPSWYSTGAGCTACHGNPPANGSNGTNTWHSGFHANNQNVGAINPNACELCHNDPTKPLNTWVPVAFSSVGADGKWHGYQINSNAITQHANGTATVYAKFVSQCFGCH